MTVTTGLERFCEEPALRRGLRRVGVLTNHSAVDRRLRHLLALLGEIDELRLARVFGPEHGVWGAAQDMIAVSSGSEPLSGAPLVSLYGDKEASLRPDPRHLADLDCLLFDIQDIGTRFYTYTASLALAIEACAEAGTACVVLDRPNPLGGELVEGNLVIEELRSFVGTIPVPVRHGMTAGELALYYNDHFHVGCDLRVVACHGWKRGVWFDSTGLPWVLPSPNMPTLDTAIVYPGACLVEATEISEGRGTTRPFELVGAPWVDGFKLAAELNAMGLAGVAFRPHFFEPTFQKHAGRVCGAVQYHVLDRQAFRPLQSGLAVLWQIRRLWPEQFAWRAAAYEFRSDVPAMDLLCGTPLVRQAMDAGVDFDKVYATACQGGASFGDERRPYLLYP